MNSKYLRPARERLIWVSVFLACVSVLGTIGAYLIHKKMPEYTLYYLTFYNHRIWVLYGLYFLTLVSIGWQIYVHKLAEKIVSNGECYSGWISEVIWQRDFLNWCEFKCQLVIRTDHGITYRSPYYTYELINCLAGINCQVYVWKKQCYVTDFRTVDREMTKEEKKTGLYGGGFFDGMNQVPSFPIMNEVKSTNKFWKKGYRGLPQRTGLVLIIFFLLCFVSTNILRMFEPVHRDSDGDGMPDSEEFAMGTDPTVYDESFFFVRTDEMNGVRLECRVEVPAPCRYDITSDEVYAFFEKQPILRVETMPGYITHPFLIVKKLTDAKMSIVLEFDEVLLTKPNFYPAIYRFHFNHQEEGMILVPFMWDGTSNVVYVDCDFADMLESGWEYYLLDGYEWQQWYDNYWN